MERVPKSGEFYRHFKNRLYQVLTVAEHSETHEKLVIYQALYGEFKTYARPLEMFVSEVDHQKYPEVAQKYRFEKVENLGEAVSEKKKLIQAESLKVSEKVSEEKSEISDVSESIDEKIMAFLDTDDFEERYNILVSMRDTITDMQINNLAVALDVVIPEGKTDERYEQLKLCLRTKQKYESIRLR